MITLFIGEAFIIKIGEGI